MIRTLSEKVRRAFEYRTTVRSVRAVCGSGPARTREQKLFLAWLADQCHATTDVSRSTDWETREAIGRRQIWVNLQHVLEMTEADLRDLQHEVMHQGG